MSGMGPLSRHSCRMFSVCDSIKLPSLYLADSHLDDGNGSKIPESPSISLKEFTGRAADADDFGSSLQNFLAGSFLLVRVFLTL